MFRLGEDFTTFHGYTNASQETITKGTDIKHPTTSLRHQDIPLETNSAGVVDSRPTVGLSGRRIHSFNTSGM